MPTKTKPLFRKVAEGFYKYETPIIIRGVLKGYKVTATIESTPTTSKLFKIYINNIRYVDAHGYDLFSLSLAKKIIAQQIIWRLAE